HGHSDWRSDGDYAVTGMADDVAMVIQALAPAAPTLIGMGLGSPVSLLAADRLAQITRLVMIDSASGARAKGERRESVAGANVQESTGGPHAIATCEESLERTPRCNRGRSERSLARGGRHKARQLDDGTWSWRWDTANRGARD